MPYGVTGYVIIRRTAEPGQAGEDRLTSVQSAKLGEIYVALAVQRRPRFGDG